MRSSSASDDHRASGRIVSEETRRRRSTDKNPPKFDSKAGDRIGGIQRTLRDLEGTDAPTLPAALFRHRALGPENPQHKLMKAIGRAEAATWDAELDGSPLSEEEERHLPDWRQDDLPRCDWFTLTDAMFDVAPAEEKTFYTDDWRHTRWASELERWAIAEASTQPDGCTTKPPNRKIYPQYVGVDPPESLEHLLFDYGWEGGEWERRRVVRNRDDRRVPLGKKLSGVPATSALRIQGGRTPDTEVCVCVLPTCRARSQHRVEVCVMPGDCGDAAGFDRLEKAMKDHERSPNHRRGIEYLKQFVKRLAVNLWWEKHRIRWFWRLINATILRWHSDPWSKAIWGREYRKLRQEGDRDLRTAAKSRLLSLVTYPELSRTGTKNCVSFSPTFAVNHERRRWMIGRGLDDQPRDWLIEPTDSLPQMLRRSAVHKDPFFSNPKVPVGRILVAWENGRRGDRISPAIAYDVADKRSDVLYLRLAQTVLFNPPYFTVHGIMTPKAEFQSRNRDHPWRELSSADFLRESAAYHKKSPAEMKLFHEEWNKRIDAANGRNAKGSADRDRKRSRSRRRGRDLHHEDRDGAKASRGSVVFAMLKAESECKGIPLRARGSTSTTTTFAGGAQILDPEAEKKKKKKKKKKEKEPEWGTEEWFDQSHPAEISTVFDMTSALSRKDLAAEIWLRVHFFGARRKKKYMSELHRKKLHGFDTKILGFSEIPRSARVSPPQKEIVFGSVMNHVDRWRIGSGNAPLLGDDNEVSSDENEVMMSSDDDEQRRK